MAKSAAANMGFTIPWGGALRCGVTEFLLGFGACWT